MVLLTIIFVGIYLLRRQRTKIREVEAPTTETKELASAIRSQRPRGTSVSNRSSYIPFFPPHQITEPIILTTKSSFEDRLSNPKMKRRQKRRPKKKLSPQKVFTKFSGGIRESWPLGSSMQIPNALRLQSHSTVTLNQVAPPGYLVPSEPKWPSRTYSRKSRSQVSVPSSGTTSRLSKEPPSPTPGPRKAGQRRAMSENHLSTVLRSTSQRLKATHRRSLSRTLTSINRKPESPPRLFMTPNKIASESREVLVERLSAVSGSSSFFEAVLAQTPTPERKVHKIAERANSKRKADTPPSAGSDDSLCVKETPEFVFPSPLASPSKSWNRRDPDQSLGISFSGSNGTSTLLQKGCRTAVFGPRPQPSDVHELTFINHSQTSLALDPFYSTGTTSKPPLKPVSEAEDLSPRPLHIRKSTFGLEGTSKRSSNFSSPLKDISGNRQSSTRSSQIGLQGQSVSSDVPVPNPFQWSPQEAVRSRPNSFSPGRSEQNRKKGHKRSKVVRISNLPRPTSVSMVPEESEDELQPPNPEVLRTSVRLVEPSRSPSPMATSLFRRHTVRPPSLSIFNPGITVPPLLSVNALNKSSLGLEIYSPTLAVTNYYNEPTSEDEFFKTAKLPKRAATTIHARRESSISPIVSPSTKLEEMISFPIGTRPWKPKSPALSPNSEILKALESRKPSPPPMPASPIVPAPPVLTMTIPIPGHLTGPRAEPRRYSSQKLPPKGTLRESICMLRRMNSEVSIVDSPSSVYSNSSIPQSSPADIQHIIRDQSPSPSPLRRVSQNRASEHYLSLGTSMHRQRVEKRDSARVTKERKSRQSQQTAQKVESKTELTPVREVTSSPASAVNAEESPALPLPLPQVSSERVKPPTQEIKEVKPGSKKKVNSASTKSSRWSDAMSKPSLKAARRESQILQSKSSPSDPSKWAWPRDSKMSLVTTIPSDSEGKENARNKHGNRSPARSDGGSEGNISPEASILPRLAADAKVDHAGGLDALLKKRGWGNWNAKRRQALGQGLPRPDSMGLYDSDGFLRSSPDRTVVERGGAGTWLEVGRR